MADATVLSLIDETTHEGKERYEKMKSYLVERLETAQTRFFKLDEDGRQRVCDEEGIR